MPGIVPLPSGTWAGPFGVWLALLMVTGSASVGQFRSGVSLVEVFAAVTDDQGRPVADLTAGDFAVEEDGVGQRIETFLAGELPLAVAIALDRSFSMTPERLAGSARAVRVFLDALGPADQVMLVAIGSETEILAPLSSDRRQARDALDHLRPWGTTPLHDATIAALSAIQAGTGRRALVLLSDGADRYSVTTAASLVARAREMDVQVYPIAVGRDRPPLFAELASVTGGRSMHATDERQLQQALTALAAELRVQYLLGYTPEPRVSADAVTGWRSIRVRVNRVGTRVRARDGYVAR